MTQANAPNFQMKMSQADSPYWGELKRAISETSGFKRWVIERGPETKDSETTQDKMVKLYLRQTLETLAY